MGFGIRDKLKKGIEKVQDEVKKELKDPGHRIKSRLGGDGPESYATGNAKYYICSKCQKKYGPIQKEEFKITRPLRSLVKVAKVHVQLDDRAKYYLAKCPDCNGWVCGSCWNPNEGSCTVCSPYVQDEHTQAEGEPFIRHDRTTFEDAYFFTCDRCDHEVGPGKSRGEFNKYLLQCPECNEWTCSRCWNENAKSCLNCNPSHPPDIRVEKGIIEKLVFVCHSCKEDQASVSKSKHKAGDEKKHMLQCPTCGHWVCGKCWNKQAGECTKCKEFIAPEMRSERSIKTQMKNAIFFICHECRDELGPVKTKHYRPGDEAGHLVQCPDCGHWVCGSCWNFKERGCKHCKPFVQPDTRTEKGKTADNVYFICSICREEYGPIIEKKWKQLAAMGFMGVSYASGGLRMIPPLLPVAYPLKAGTYIASKHLGKEDGKDVKSKKDKDEKGQDSSKKFLGQCPECNKWVCMECWDQTDGKCDICAGN